MTHPPQGRMLLAHNFDLTEAKIPRLSREEFAAVFIKALDDCAQCRLVNHPHWIVEVLFDPAQFSPNQMGDRYVQALVAQRRSQVDAEVALPQMLILGGSKTTPATSDSPDALQPENWGVDVVETLNAERFLQGIDWETAIATKPPDLIFKVEFKPSD